MRVPWTCSSCSSANLIDLRSLDVRTVNKLVNRLGFLCTSCGEFVEVRRDSGSYRDLLNRLSRYTPQHEQYRFLLRKLVHKAVNMMEKDYN